MDFYYIHKQNKTRISIVIAFWEFNMEKVNISAVYLLKIEITQQTWLFK